MMGLNIQDCDAWTQISTKAPSSVKLFRLCGSPAYKAGPARETKITLKKENISLKEHNYREFA